MRAGEAVVEALRTEGVRHVFGLVGSSLIEILDALHRCPEIEFVGVRHEQTAAHMADAYARIGDGPAVCLATNGPGAANLVTGVATAYRTHAPVVAITGAPLQPQMHRGAFQEIDQCALFAPITKATIEVRRAELIPDLLRDAFRVAMSGKRGPVHVNLPRDVLNDDLESPAFTPPDASRPRARPAPDPALVDDAARSLLDADAPVIVAGGGVAASGGGDWVLRLAELLGAPVVTSYGHHDAVRGAHDLVVGQLGRAGSPEAGHAVAEADLVLAVGTRLGHFTAFFDNRFVRQDARVVQIELDPRELGRHYPVEIGICADAAATAEALCARVEALVQTPRAGRRESIAAWRDERLRRRRAALAIEDVPIKAARVVAHLAEVLPPDAIVVADATAGAVSAYDLLDFTRPQSFLDSLDFGCVGCGLPFALGAKVAAPQRPVVALVGDGGFLMSVQDLETAVRHRIDVVVIVMSNGCWGLEKAYQKFFYGGRYIGADFANPPFDALAELFGAEGMRAEHPGELAPVLDKALAASGRPVVVEVPVDPDDLPYPARSDAVRGRD